IRLITFRTVCFTARDAPEFIEPASGMGRPFALTGYDRCSRLDGRADLRRGALFPLSRQATRQRNARYASTSYWRFPGNPAANRRRAATYSTEIPFPPRAGNIGGLKFCV